MIAIFERTYLVVGPSQPPQVVLIDRQQHEMYLNNSTSANPHCAADAVRYTFGSGFDQAFAAWHEELMRVLGTTYEGPFEREVRALAAAIVLNITFEALAKNQKGGNGGEKVRQPKRPVRPQPGGIAVPIPV
jgi:hypothetical protein